MDSRGPPAPPPHHHQHHQPPHQHHHQHPQPPQGMMLQHHHHHQHHQHQQHQQHQHQHQHQQHHHHPSNSSFPTQNMPNSSPNPHQMIATPNSSSSAMLQNNRFPFTSQLVTTTPPPSKTQLETHNSPYSGDGLRSSGFGIDPNSSSSQKKKRGRPRKYSPDGGGSNIALGLAPTPISSSIVGTGAATGGSGGGGGGQADSSGTAPSSENPSKRHRGRPPGSSKKQLDALGNCGVGFTPHVILVNAGEDIASKIIAFSKQGPRTVCILSANGSICNVSLRQPTVNGGVVHCEGRYEIISLSGSFLFSENSGGLRTGGLSISLAGSDGHVLGGGVAGMLIAASTVQIIVGSFIANGKKTKYMPSVPQSNVLNFSASAALPATDSPPSQDGSSEGSEENGSNHIDRTMGSYGNSNHPMHHHNMQMYNPMGWPNSGSKMLQN